MDEEDYGEIPEDPNAPETDVFYTVWGWFDGYVYAEDVKAFPEAARLYRSIYQDEVTRRKAKKWYMELDMNVFIIVGKNKDGPIRKYKSHYTIKYEGTYRQYYEETCKKADEKIAALFPGYRPLFDEFCNPIRYDD
jgi:hypothetical protein